MIVDIIVTIFIIVFITAATGVPLTLYTYRMMQRH
jgi:hypothetical protein